MELPFIWIDQSANICLSQIYRYMLSISADIKERNAVKDALVDQVSSDVYCFRAQLLE